MSEDQDAGRDQLKIDNMYLCGSAFTRVSLKDSTFADSHFMTARFDDVNMSGVTIHNANLTGAQFSDVNLSEASIRFANWSGLSINDANLTGMTINGILVSDLLKKWED